MAFASYQDLFKLAVDEAVGGDFEYEVTGSGAVSASHPITKAQTRNLGTHFRFNPVSNNVSVTFESVNATTSDHLHLCPIVVGVLGHSLGYSNVVTLTWFFRVGSTKTASHILFSDKADNFNNEYFLCPRDRHEDVPYKVVITIYVGTVGEAIDVGRFWCGPMFELDNPDTSAPGLLMAGWKTGFMEGAKSKLTRGNQSYSNRLPPLKTLDFSLVLPNDGELNNWQQLLGDNGETSAGFSLDQQPSIMGMQRHLQQGGACIVVPKEITEDTNAHTLAKVLKSRLGIYGESGQNAGVISHDSSTLFSSSFRIRQLQ